MAFLYILGWMLCAAIAFRLVVYAWLLDFGKVTLGDAIAFAFISVVGGPGTVVIGALLAACSWADSREDRKEIVLWRREKR